MTELKNLYDLMTAWMPDLFSAFFRGIFLVCVSVTFADIFLKIVHFVRGK